MLIVTSVLAAAQLLSLPQDALQPALAPRFAGVFRPGHGFQPYQQGWRTSAAEAYSAGDLMAWQVLPGEQHLLVEEGRMHDGRGSVQVNAVTLHYASSRADESGAGGELQLALEDPRSGVWKEWRLAGLPLGGTDGSARAWTVVVDLRGGHEIDLPAGEVFRWSVATADAATGLLLAMGGPGADNALDWHDLSSGTRLARAPIGIEGAALALELHALPAGTRALYPQAGQAMPSLALSSDQVVAGDLATWRLEQPHAQRSYALLISAAAGLESTGGGMLLLDRSALVARPVLMPSGEVTLSIPHQAAGRWFSQAVEFEGRLESGVFRAVSNALEHDLRP